MSYIVMILFMLVVLCAYVYFFIQWKKSSRKIKESLERLAKLQNDMEQIELNMIVINKQIDGLLRMKGGRHV